MEERGECLLPPFVQGASASLCLYEGREVPGVNSCFFADSEVSLTSALRLVLISRR